MVAQHSERRQQDRDQISHVVVPQARGWQVADANPIWERPAIPTKSTAGAWIGAPGRTRGNGGDAGSSRLVRGMILCM